VSQVLVLLAYLGGALLLTTLAARRQRMWTPSRLQPAITL
jgi:putative membrane protein